MQLGFFRGIAGRVCFSSFLIVFAGIFSARSAFCSQLHPPFLLTADVVSTPSAGGPGRFIWAVTPECAADCATLEVKVEMPGGIQVYLTSQTLAFAAGKTVSGFFDFTPPVPGRYEVTALVAADLQGFARFADAKQVLLDVPEQGPATVATRPNSRPTDARIPANLCSTAKEPAVAVTPVHLSSTSSRIQVVFKYERYTAYPVAATPPLWVKEDAKVIRFADVEIDGPAGLVRGLSTDASGKITATYPAPSLQGVKIRLFARMKDVCAVESVPFFGWNYTGHGDVYSIEKDASEINGTVATILKGSMASGPWAILDTIIDGWQYAKAIEYNALRNSSLSVPMVYARWQHGYAGASDYSSDLQLVRLDGGLSVVDTPAQFNRAIILHEYAHHLSHTLSTDKSTGTSDGHTYLTPLPPPTAWSEAGQRFSHGPVTKPPFSITSEGPTTAPFSHGTTSRARTSTELHLKPRGRNLKWRWPRHFGMCSIPPKTAMTQRAEYMTQSRRTQTEYGQFSAEIFPPIRTAMCRISTTLGRRDALLGSRNCKMSC